MSETTPPTANPAPANESVPAVVEDRFVHLHLHTDYSILDGLVDPYTLVRTAGHLGQPAVAITDHGRLSGTAEFYDAIGWYNRVHAERHPQTDDCLKNGCHSVLDCRAEKRCPKKGSAVGAEQHAKITPLLGILGLETYVAHHGRESREKGDWGHLVLLSKNERGWANLRALASRASLEGFYSKPRVDRELLAEHHEGLIALSACLGGHLAIVWRNEGAAEADDLIRWYKTTFGDDYLLELQWHNDQDPAGGDRAHEQWDFNRYLISASERLGVRLVLTNDSHYARKDQALLEEIVLANQQQMTLAEVAEAKRSGKGVLSFDTPDFYVKSRGEMGQALANWLRIAETHAPDLAKTIREQGKTWLETTLEIATRTEAFIPFRTGLHFPQFPVPEGATAESYLADLVWERAKGRYPQISEQTRRLIAYELQCVQELGFSAYFLITADFVDYARAEGIDVGLGRGSAPGSVVTYVLGITDVDPVAYGLSEGGIGLTRFLNPTVLYGLSADGFGTLSPEAASLVAPSAEEMESEMSSALRAAHTNQKEAFARGEGFDAATGSVFPKHLQEEAQERWRKLVKLAADEWTTVRRLGAANEVASAAQTDTRLHRTSLVEPLWRWLRHRAGGGAAGTKNDHQSYIARLLGLTSEQAKAPSAGEPALLPLYEFRHSRKSMPDIDIDFTPGHDGREKVMRYVVDKYGADHVAQIATFGTMLSKSAIKDVARAKGMPPQEADALTLLVPKKFQAQADDTGETEIPGVSLAEMISSEHPAVVEGSRELRTAMARDPMVNEIIRLASEIEGMKRTVSTHACGVLITPLAVTEYVSVEKTAKGTGMQAVHDGPTLTDKLGLLKVDFLGLKNLQVNRGTVDRIRERQGRDVEWRAVPDDDPDAMRLLRDGRTLGIFQFASDFATGILKQMKPKRVQDLMVATALGRPGPMEYIPKYVEARAAGKGEYGDPVFERIASPILEETYGVLVYQEQVMLLAIDLSAFTLPESDGLRKATAKKDAALLAKYRDKFVDGAVRSGVDRAFIEHYWDAVLTPFAAYSFNKSHSTAYALTAYKQAYLKAHFLPEFMASLMTVDQNETAKERGAVSPLAKAIAEARRVGIEMLAIDVNRSTDRVEIEDDTHLRMSLAAIKGIGDKPVNAILAAREHGPFADLRDFIKRTVEVEREKDPKTGRTVPAAVNKTVTLGLIRAGAFDAFGDRGVQIALAEAYFGTTSVKKRASLDWSVPPGRTDGIAPKDWLEAERELLGFYLSAHPANSIDPARVAAFVTAQEAIEKRLSQDKGKQPRDINQATIGECLVYDKVRDSECRVLAGVINGLRYVPNRSGNGGRLRGRFEDETGSANVVIWQPRETDGRAVRDAFRELQANPDLANGAGVIIAGGFSFNPQWDKEPGIVADRWELIPFAQSVSAAPVAAAVKQSDPTKLSSDAAEVEAGLATLFDE